MGSAWRFGKGCAGRGARSSGSASEAAAEEKNKATPPTEEIFLHRDNDITVWKQLGREWKFEGAVFWTLGAGTGVRAFFEERKATFALALNDTHIEEVEKIVDKASMEHMKTQTAKIGYMTKQS